MPLILRELPTKLHGHSASEARHQCSVLEAIAANPGITKYEIAQKVGISPTVTQTYLTQFFRDGIVTRSKAGQKYFYSLTPVTHGR